MIIKPIIKIIIIKTQVKFNCSKMIHGEAKRKFTAWYFGKGIGKVDGETKLSLVQFWNMPFLVQYSVFERFFQLHGISPEVMDSKEWMPELDREQRYHTVVKMHEKHLACGFHPSADEAQKEAIEVANEKFNLKYL